MKKHYLGLALAGAAVGLAGIVPDRVSSHVVVKEATYQPSEIDAAKESIALSLMGQLQMSVADLMWLKSMEYLHRGSVQRMPTRGEEDIGFMRTDSTGTAVGLGHTEGVNMILDANRDWRGVLGEIQRHTACYSEAHVHDDPVELIPWYQLAVKMNPKLERLYTLGAFFLTDFAREPGEAREMLVAGLQANPDSFEVQAALGRLLFEYSERLGELEHDDEHHEEDHPEAAEEAYHPETKEEACEMAVELLRKAVDNALKSKLALRDRQEKFDEFQEQIHSESYLFLSKAYVELGRNEEALAACDEGWEFAKHTLLRVQRRVVARLMGIEPEESDG
jgi:hypothetical protein